MKTQYKRVLLKVSGEVFSGSSGSAFDFSACDFIAREIAAARKTGVQIAIVIGGGNIFRGSIAEPLGFDRVDADEAGMTATTVNGLILAQSLKRIDVPTRVMNAVPSGSLEVFSKEKAMKALKQGEVVIFSGGTGLPFFTTDTAAALRACEIQADILLKGTKVDGIYDKDPMKCDDAKRYDTLQFEEALAQRLEVMDQTAFALCRSNNLPIAVFNVFTKDAIVHTICNQKGYTLVSGD